MDIENYINLIKAIIEIEKYFNVKFDIPNKIPEDDIDTIEELYKKIMEQLTTMEYEDSPNTRELKKKTI